MKAFINNHVHGSQMATIDNNGFSVDPQTIAGYGLKAKFEISPIYPVVVEYVPREGLIGLIFSAIRWFRPSRTLVLHLFDAKVSKDVNATENIQWKELFPLRYILSKHIKGCRIRTNRLDRLPIYHSVNAGAREYKYEYMAFITAEIDPIPFYNFAKSSENSKVLYTTLENSIKDIISAEIIRRAGNATFILHTKISSPVFEQAGYRITDCEIQYFKTIY